MPTRQFDRPLALGALQIAIGLLRISFEPF